MKLAFGDVRTPLDATLARNFLSIPPDAHDGIARSRVLLEGRSFPRQEVAEILLNYNTELGNDPAALANAKKLSLPNSSCVVTGQQLGFMGGPAFVFIKAISCLLLAREADAIPIFWLATEDHDLDEINHVHQIDPYGNLVRYHLNWPQAGAAVEDLPLLPQHQEVIKAFWQALNPTKAALPVDAGSSRGYAYAMAQLLVKAFEGTGMVFLEPRLLRPLAGAFFQKEIRECDAMSATLQETTQRLSAAGATPVLDISSGPNLFYRDSLGHRRRMRKEGAYFRVGPRLISETEMLAKANAHPELFSTSVAARPVLQSLLLPTLAYVAGPTELAYHCQLADYHQAHDVPMPWIVPRLSATFITPTLRSILESLNLTMNSTLPQTWNEVMPEIEGQGIRLAEACRRAVETEFEGTIPTGSLTYSLEHFIRQAKVRAVQQRLDQLGIPYHALHLLRNLLQPQDKRQERVLSWWIFQAEAQCNLVQELLSRLDWRESRHYYIDIP